MTTEVIKTLLAEFQTALPCILMNAGFCAFLIASLFHAMSKHNFFEWYDTNRKRFMPQRCLLCWPLWLSAALMAAFIPGNWPLIFVPFLVPSLVMFLYQPQPSAERPKQVAPGQKR